MNLSLARHSHAGRTRECARGVCAGSERHKKAARCGGKGREGDGGEGGCAMPAVIRAVALAV